VCVSGGYPSCRCLLHHLGASSPFEPVVLVADQSTVPGTRHVAPACALGPNPSLARDAATGVAR